MEEVPEEFINTHKCPPCTSGVGGGGMGEGKRLKNCILVHFGR